MFPIIKSMLSNIGGRRFFMCLLVIGLTTVLVLFNKLGGEIYRDVTIFTLSAYIVGNTTQKVFTKQKDDTSGN